MIVRCKNKAKTFRAKKSKEKRDKKKSKVIVVPHSQHVSTIAQFLKPADVIIVSRVGKNVGQIVKKGKSKKMKILSFIISLVMVALSLTMAKLAEV